MRYILEVMESWVGPGYEVYTGSDGKLGGAWVEAKSTIPQAVIHREGGGKL